MEKFFWIVSLWAGYWFISREFGALLQAIAFANKYRSTLPRWYVITLRYRYASWLFHEAFCLHVGRPAAWKATTTLVVMNVTFLPALLAGMNLVTAFGASVIASTAFFFVRYGHSYAAEMRTIKYKTENVLL